MGAEEEEAKPFVKRALDAGINFFDTADVYSLGESERSPASLLRDFGVKRENVIIATKVNGQMSDDINDKGLSRKHILDSIDKSLQRLQMDYVDLYQIHRWDYETPIEETLEALNDVVRAGKARYIGASSMFAWQFAKALHTSEKHGWTKFVSMQNHYNLVYREEEREMIPLCIDQGIGLIPWSPWHAASSRGTANAAEAARRSAPTAIRLRTACISATRTSTVADRAAEVAKERGVTGSQIALAWILSKPYVTARSSARPKWIISTRPSPRSTSSSPKRKSSSWKNRTSRIPFWDMPRSGRNRVTESLLTKRIQFRRIESSRGKIIL